MRMSELGESFDGAGVAPSAGAVDLLLQLEERVAALVERHREARVTIDELRATLAERLARLATLEAELESAGKLRTELRQRVARLIEQVGELERAHSDGRSQ